MKLKLISEADVFSVLLSADNPSSDYVVELIRAFAPGALPLAAGIYFYATTRDLIEANKQIAEKQIQLNKENSDKQIEASEKQNQLNKENSDKQIEISALKMEALFQEYFKKLKSDA